MDYVSLFPFESYWSFYLGFSAFVLALLILDLGVFHRTAHEVKFKEALIWSVVWFCVALLFNALLYLYSSWKFSVDPRFLNLGGFVPDVAAQQVAIEFFTGFIVEKSLAVDNLFVFVVVFSFFGIPSRYQHRVLFFGIIGAIVFRAIFIAASSVLMQYALVVFAFGILLILTGIKMFFAPRTKIDPDKNIIIRGLKRIMPISSSLSGERFFIRKEGVWYATPLFVALVFIEVSDIIFAVDSVPAIFAITREPFIVFTSNVLALLGLRSLYFLLAGAYDRFHLLKYGLGTILIFVGLKMSYLNELMGGKFPIGWSLSIIVSVLMLSIISSLLIPARSNSSGSV